MFDDDWLKTIEKKLQVVQCNNREKVLFASHHLVGPAADWWDAYVEAHEELESINWQEFKNSFRSHHVSLGVMKLKKNEFEDLKQGSMSVSEYVTRFTQLSRYAPDNVDTNEKKQDCFLNGLNDGLAYALEARDFVNFQDMVDKALALKTEGELWNERERCSTLDHKEATLNSMLVHHHKAMCPSWAVEWTAKSASCKSRISNSSATDSALQLPISSLYTAATTEEQ
jgi:hypothetical protein